MQAYDVTSGLIERIDMEGPLNLLKKFLQYRHDIFFRFETITIIYFMISIIASRIWPLPAIKIISISLSIILIPILTGKTFISLLYKTNIFRFSPVSLYIVEWLTGNLFIYFFAAIFSYVNILEPTIFSYSLVLLPLTYLVAKRYTEKNVSEIKSYNNVVAKEFGNKIVFPFILLAGFLPLYQLAPILPFPLSPTQSWTRILLSMQFITKGYVDLVHGYSHWSSVIISPLSIIYDMHPLEVLSATNVVSHIAYPFILYLICYKITKNEIISLIPAFLGPWIFLLGNLKLTALENTPLVFHIFTCMIYLGLDYCSSPLPIDDFREKSLLLSPFIIFLSPLIYIFGKGGKIIPPRYFIFFSLISPIILIVVYILLNKSNYGKDLLVLFIFPSTLATIAHPYLGPMIVFFLICFILGLIGSEKRISLFRIFFLVTPWILIILVRRINIDKNFLFTKWLFGNLLIGSGLDINIFQKWSRFLSEGPTVSVYLFILSFMLIGLNNDKKYRPLMFASSAILLMTFFPEGLLWRAVQYLNPLSSVMISYVPLILVSMVEKIMGKSTFNKEILITTFSKQTQKYSFRFKVRSLMISFFTISLLMSLLPSAISMKTQYFNYGVQTRGEGYCSWVHSYEVNSSFWFLKQYKDDRILIISDPATSFFLGTITLKDTLMFEYAEFYPEVYPNQTWIHMKQLKDNIFSSLGEKGSAGRIYELLENFSRYNYYNYLREEYNNIFLVVTPRTDLWFSHNITLPIPAKANPINFADVVVRLDIDADFTLVYAIDDLLYIYELSK